MLLQTRSNYYEFLKFSSASWNDFLLFMHVMHQASRQGFAFVSFLISHAVNFCNLFYYNLFPNDIVVSWKLLLIIQRLLSRRREGFGVYAV